MTELEIARTMEGGEPEWRITACDSESDEHSVQIVH